MITVLHRSCPGTDYNVHIIQCRIVRCQIVRVPNRPTIHWIHLNTASLHIGWWYVLWDFFLSFESKIEIPGAELWCSNIPCLLPCHRLKRPKLVSNHNLNVWRKKRKERKCLKSSISVQKIEARPSLFIDCPLVFRCMWKRTGSKVLSLKI